EAGISWTPLPDLSRADQVTTAVRGHAEERDADVRAVRHALGLLDTASAERTRAERLADRARTARDGAAAEIARAEAAVTVARTEASAALRDWWSTHREVYAPQGNDIVDALETAVAQTG
ncbi:hypothetical protein GV791_31205, partial [Nocardia cyriacigeorgica]